MECYACEQEATQRCPRCGKPYCGDHGANLCLDCLDPAAAAPSNVVFRVSLFGLLGASVLALWLLIRPPDVPGDTSAVVQPTPAPTAAPTIFPTESPSPTPSPVPTGTVTPAPTPTPAAPTPISYTIQDGDTIAGIADAYGISYLDLLAANGLTEEQAELLQPGDTIIIPSQ